MTEVVENLRNFRHCYNFTKKKKKMKLTIYIKFLVRKQNVL